MWAKIAYLNAELVRSEPAMRALVPWDTGNSRLFLWLSGLFVLVAVAVAAAKVASLVLKGATNVVAPRS